MELQEELALRRASQISLLHCVTPNLRQLNVIRLNKNITLNFYYEYMEEMEKEIPSEIEAEMWGFFYGEAEISTNIIISPLPNPIPLEGLCVYARFEEGSQLFNKIDKTHENEKNIHLLVSHATQISLLGCVTPNLRKILFEEREGKFVLHLYYNEMTEQEKSLPVLVGGRVQSFFADREVVVCVSMLSFPKLIPEGSAIYARYEIFD